MKRRTGRVRRAVLGIDAAWTAAAPSGVALVVEGERGWTCAGLAPGYGRMKRYEDALVCAWVGIEFLEGRALPYGDGDAAVRIPSERTGESAACPRRG